MQLMSNKSTTKEDTKNSVFTPKEVKEALDNLPYNYIVTAKKKLCQKIEAGDSGKTYSGTWIAKVRKGEKFNEEILTVLIEIGRTNLEKKKRFGFKTKKTSSTN